MTQESYEAQVAEAQQKGQEQQDQIVKQHLADALKKAESGGPREVAGAAVSLESAYQMGAVDRGVISSDAMTSVVTLIQREIDEHPEEKPVLLAVRGRLEIAAGQKETGIASLRASMDAKPTVGAFLALAAALDEGKRGEDIVPLAKKTLAETSTDDERYEVLLGVMVHTHATTPDSGLSWASAADRKLYLEQTALREEEARVRNEEHRRQQQEHTAKMHAEFEESRRRSDDARRCSARCDADASTCRSHCGTGGFCITDCEDARSACKRSCS